VLVKRYVPETGTAWVRTISTPSAGNTVLVAQTMQAEDSLHHHSRLERRPRRKGFAYGLADRTSGTMKRAAAQAPIRAGALMNLSILSNLWR
jgi:hypothetical protein